MSAVTLSSSECPQSADATVTPETDEQLAERLFRDELEMVHLRSGQHGQRGRRFLRQIAKTGTVPEWISNESTPQSIRDLVATANDSERHRSISQRATELARWLTAINRRYELDERQYRAVHATTVLLHGRLERERQIDYEELTPLEKKIVRVPGAHVRMYDCAGWRRDGQCSRHVVVYHRPRSVLCSECAAEMHRIADRNRKWRARGANKVPRPTTCPCGAPLDAQRSTRRYCSPACRQTAYRMRVGSAVTP